MTHRNETSWNRTSRRLVGPLALVALLALGIRPAVGQELGMVVSGETAGDDVSLIFSQLSAVWGTSPGLRPVASLGGYWLDTPGDNTWSFGPAVGLRYQTSTGMLQGKVGYSWKDDDAGIPIFGGGESGVSTSLHAEYWGTGTFGAQALGSYNWGSDYLWTRGRLTARVAEPAGGSLLLGGEYSWQGEREEGPGYDARMYGPTAVWIGPSGFIMGLAGGWKNTHSPDDSTWYLRVDFVFDVN